MGKAQRARELKKAFGPEIAESFDQLSQQVLAVGLQQRVLAKEFHERERDVAAVRQGREHDKRELGAKVDDLRDQVEALGLRVDAVEKAERVLSRCYQQQSDRITSVNTSICRVLCWIRHHTELTRWQRFRAFITATPAVRFNPFIDPATTSSLQQVMKDSLQPLVDDVSVITHPTPAQGEEFFR